MAQGANGRIQFFLNRLRERLWIKPLFFAGVSIAAALIAETADSAGLAGFLPAIRRETVEVLLEIMAASMLVIATLSVTSMISAYSSASAATTPRTFPLIVADDLSQNALSTFVGAFIFSIVALIALKNGFYEESGFSSLFLFTIVVFAIVILVFVRWVDGVARLGRLGNTIDKVEEATTAAMARRRRDPALGGKTLEPGQASGHPVFSDRVGYVQQIEMERLQKVAESAGVRITINALPGTLAAPGKPLVLVSTDGTGDIDESVIREAFVLGRSRVFEDDPRLGLVVLSEIAGRALSPAVNDPGTAIAVISVLVRLFSRWAEPIDAEDSSECQFDRVYVPHLAVADMFEDAFTAVARDGAGSVEVAVRLQKGLSALACLDDPEVAQAAGRHARLALSRSERALDLDADIERVREAAGPASIHP